MTALNSECVRGLDRREGLKREVLLLEQRYVQRWELWFGGGGGADHVMNTSKRSGDVGGRARSA